MSTDSGTSTPSTLRSVQLSRIAEGVYLGECEPTVQPYPSSFPGSHPDGTVEDFGAYDPDRARELLAEAGYGDGLTLTTYTLTITTYSDQAEIYQAQLGEVGITANYIRPGAIITGITRDVFAADDAFRGFWEQKAALKRLGQPEDIANAIAFLASDEAAFITGHGLLVDGGALQSP
jgi:ABC-type transport system substrate-binding protein